VGSIPTRPIEKRTTAVVLFSICDIINLLYIIILYLMASTLPKKAAKRAVKQDQTAVQPPPALKTGTHHGLATVTLILLFLTIGCVAAAALMSEKTKTLVDYASSLATQLDRSQKQSADLTEEVANLKTLQILSKKVISPAVPPIDIVWKTYSSPNISIQYPDSYTVVKATSSFPALTIKSDKGRIEIFRMKDFPGGDRPFGFEDASVSQGELDNYIPKEFKSAANSTDSKVTPYSVWIFYGTGDEETKAVLDQAVSTIKVTK
jgi:hypothetical protein